MKKGKFYFNFVNKQEQSYINQIEPKELSYFTAAYFSEQPKVLTSDIEINKNGIFQFGTDISQITKLYKKPTAETLLQESHSIKTIYYKQRISQKKANCEFSFYNDNLFHFSYSFKYLAENEKQKIIKLITQKYLGRNINISDLKIADRQGNFIILNNFLYLTISYFSSNNFVVSHINNLEIRAKKISRLKQRNEYSELLKIL